jgi:hypothetical protein
MFVYKSWHVAPIVKEVLERINKFDANPGYPDTVETLNPSAMLQNFGQMWRPWKED